MDQRDQTGAEVSRGVQPRVVVDQRRDEIGEELFALRDRQGVGDPARRDRQQGRLRDARRRDVAGANARVLDLQIVRLPASWLPSAKIMCGSIPLAHCARSSARSSAAARSGS